MDYVETKEIYSDIILWGLEAREYFPQIIPMCFDCLILKGKAKFRFATDILFSGSFIKNI